jgi:hypothetical protein
VSTLQVWTRIGAKGWGVSLRMRRRRYEVLSTLISLGTQVGCRSPPNETGRPLNSAAGRPTSAATWQVAIFVPGSLDSLSLVRPVLLLRFIRTAEKIVSLKR